MAEMHEYFRRSREYEPRSDTRSLEVEFASMGPRQEVAFKKACLDLGGVVPIYVKCTEEAERKILDIRVGSIINTCLDEAGITNSRKIVFRARLYALFSRRVAKAKGEREE